MRKAEDCGSLETPWIYFPGNSFCQLRRSGLEGKGQGHGGERDSEVMAFGLRRREICGLRGVDPASGR